MRPFFPPTSIGLIDSKLSKRRSQTELDQAVGERPAPLDGIGMPVGF